MDDPEVSPNCTDFCTDSGKFRGHRVLDETATQRMLVLLQHRGIRRLDTEYPYSVSDADFGRALTILYRYGFGYNQVADLLGRGHEETYLKLTSQ